MRPIGYLYKNVSPRPEWIQAAGVVDVYSLSDCVSGNFADYIGYWRHNGYWLFDDPATMEALAVEHGIPLARATLFYFEAFEQQFDDESGAWSAFGPDPSFATDVVPPGRRTLEGYDVASFALGNMPECSPLSCNGRASDVATNAHCLFRTFDQARLAIESGRLAGSEPGPFRIVAVYSVDAR